MASSPLFCTNCGAANTSQASFCFACGQALQHPGAESFISNASKPATGNLSTNTLLKDRYLILGQLGSGGMGAVYKAKDTLFNHRLVAVKEMSQLGLNAQQKVNAADDFKREAHMLADLHHSSLPTIYDYFSEEGQWYLVMDFIEGETLEARLAQTAGGWLPIQKALTIGIHLCTVLSYLHTQQPPIVFRDLKPANVMLTPNEQVFLIDFGIARHFKPGQMKDTVSFGSAGYAAPEQYGKTQTTPRSDIYSLGAMLHQCLTSNDPSNNSPTPFNFPPLDLHGQPAPSALARLIMQMVESNPQNRPSDMAYVKQKLQYIAQQLTAPKSIPQRGQIPLAQPSSRAFPHSFVPIPPPTLLPPLPRIGANTPAPRKPPILPPPPTTITQRTYRGHPCTVHILAWSPDGRKIASADQRGKIHLWNATTTGILHCHESHTSTIGTLQWSPQGTYIASGDDSGGLEIWNATNGQRVYKYQSYIANIIGVAWSLDNKRIMIADTRGRIQIQDAFNGKHPCVYHGPNNGIQALAWSPDGKYIASADKNSPIQVWEITTGWLIFTYLHHSAQINSIAWSPDGKRIASGDVHGKIHVWSALNGNTSYTYSGHTGAVKAIAWSPNSKRIASGGLDTTVHLWNATDGGNTFIYRRHSWTVLTVAWSPDATLIASGGIDKTVQVWVAK